MESIRRCLPVAAVVALLATVALGAPPARAAVPHADDPRSANGSVEAQIVGGRDATAAEATGSAAVLARGNPDARDALICSGSLVAAQWVLTAAHCVEDLDASDLDVVVGSAELTGGERIPIASGGVLVHPDYTVRDDGWFADLALLRLGRATTAEPITLAGPQHWEAWAPGEQLTLLGWGETETEPVPERLQAATMPAERLAACMALLGIAFDAATMLCGGPEGVGICTGDSGGPLLAGSGDAARQVGVASAGAEAECGSAEPDTYTDVTAFGGWLRTASDDAIAIPARAALRLQGADRYATAAAISRHTYDRADVVYVATGEDFPDGLAAGPVAARRGAPLLLSAGDHLPAATVAELGRLAPDEIVLVGGVRTLSEGVARQLRAIAPTTRVLGRTRYDTAAQLSRGWPTTPTQVVLATGEAFPDALAGVPLAARVGPLLLTHPDGLPRATAERLGEIQPERVLVLGGGGAVPEAVLDEVGRVAPDAVIERISGPTRYDTAAAVSQHPAHWPAPRLLYVATGAGFSDALAGGVAAATHRAPLVLTTPTALPTGTRELVETLGGRPVVLGGSGAVDDAVVGDLNRLFRR